MRVVGEEMLPNGCGLPGGCEWDDPFGVDSFGGKTRPIGRCPEPAVSVVFLRHHPEVYLERLCWWHACLVQAAQPHSCRSDAVGVS